jgi:hypothetical protein
MPYNQFAVFPQQSYDITSEQQNFSFKNCYLCANFKQKKIKRQYFMKRNIALLLLMVAVISCGKVKEKAKETINKGGEMVGKTGAEFFEGVSEGVDKTLQCEISLSQGLKNKGLKTGKFSINNSQEGGINNQLTLYLIFDKDFKSSITVKVCDKTGLEMGRTKLEIENQAGNAGYYDFAFDRRTCVEVKSKIYLE